jgi:hypothetical protein
MGEDNYVQDYYYGEVITGATAPDHAVITSAASGDFYVMVNATDYVVTQV